VNREERRRATRLAGRTTVKAEQPSTNPRVAARNLRRIADETDASITGIEEQITAFEVVLENLRGMIAAAEAMRDSYRQAADALERNNAA
jgi:hypothetical protein